MALLDSPEVKEWKPSALLFAPLAVFAVPMALALALQRSGDFVAALDWFRTVYADGSTLSSSKIYPGLVA